MLPTTVNNRYKTQLCKHFSMSGQCPVGQKCHFAHGHQELRSILDPIPPQATIVQTDPMSAMLQQSTVGMNYKTVLCKNYQAMGVCKYGPTCQFAHGENDLKRPEQTAAVFQAQAQVIQAQQMQIKIQMYQLQYILYQIEQSQPKDPIIYQKFKNAVELWQANNRDSCVELLNQIMYRTDASLEEKNFYNKITQEAQQLAQNYLQQFQQQQMGLGSQV